MFEAASVRRGGAEASEVRSELLEAPVSLGEVCEELLEAPVSLGRFAENFWRVIGLGTEFERVAS